MKHIFVTIQGGEITPYGNLKTLSEDIEMASKYSTIHRAIASTGKAVIEDIEIRKLYVVRGPRQIKNG